jgi:CheY-like chemotaxis protein
MNLPQGPLLVVEDIAQIRELLEVTLRFKGYPVVAARDGQEALDLIDEQRPALVITDILMPKLDGFALAYELRHDPRTRDVPIIFLSATYVAPEDREFAMRLGAVRFLEKPVDTEEFLLTVAEVLTQGLPTLPTPLDKPAFYRGYRGRLEDKLRHKSNQITRIERLLQDLPESQKSTFESLLAEARGHREQIQGELDHLFRILQELDG